MKFYKDTTYKVSNEGIVFRNEKQLKPRYDKDGYKIISITLNGKKTTKSIHRLVAETYLENPNNLSQVNHKDGNKDNNFVSNLEWITPKGNTHHAIENNLRDTRGINNTQAVLTEKQVREIRDKFEPRQYTYKMLCEEYKVSETQIYRIIYNKCWKHI